MRLIFLQKHLLVTNTQTGLVCVAAERFGDFELDERLRDCCYSSSRGFIGTVWGGTFVFVIIIKIQFETGSQLKEG